MKLAQDWNKNEKNTCEMDGKKDEVQKDVMAEVKKIIKNELKKD